MSEQVKLNWNGKEIVAKKGSNLLAAALDNGIEVAHFCYHRGLPVAGVCRMCMVSQDGVPRPFPACNASVAEGMNVRNDTPQIKEAVEATLQFHLVNHPLDCPVCDQAGECSLQENYMNYGQYDSKVLDKKVHKDKVQDIGRDVMLDAERCILCTRCTRFTSEITKTNELGILNRGDHAEITVFESLKNDYAQNLVDICPVGALTSKDFRFKQRSWFLEDVYSTCIGCDTGCAIKVSQNKTGSYRVKPVFDEAVNGHFMCDDGRGIYKHTSSVSRLQNAMKKSSDRTMFVSINEDEIKLEIENAQNVKIILSTDLSNEEYRGALAALKTSKKKLDVALFKHSHYGPEFDGILKRSNKNANLKGAEAAFLEFGFDASDDKLNKLLANISSSDVVLIVLPEITYDNDDKLAGLLKSLEKAKLKIGLTSNEPATKAIFDQLNFILPLPTFLEKNGTMTNFNQIERKLNAGLSFGETSKNIINYAKWMSL